MCLITDYSPENLVVASAEQHTSAVVEVATAENREESSYLSTYWAKRDEMHCGASHTGFGELEGEDPESGNGIAGRVQGWRHSGLGAVGVSRTGLQLPALQAMLCCGPTRQRKITLLPLFSLSFLLGGKKIKVQ